MWLVNKALSFRGGGGGSINIILSFRLIQQSLYQPQFLRSGLRKSSNAKRKNDVQIVVIGAGLAGLSAANHLLQHGFQRTILLEASDRLGGRVSSKLFGDAFCELGAKWVTIDATKNSVYELLQQAMVAKKIQQRKEVFYVTQAGEQVNQGIPELVEELYKRLSSGIELKEKYKANSDLNDLNNVQTYFEAETSKIVTTLFKESDQSIASDIFHSLCKEFGSLFGCCLEYMNIVHIVKKRPHGEVPVYIPTGLDNVLNHIARNIDAEHMKVGKPVGEIKWHGSTRLDQKSVGCLDGSLFNADHIICTLPLGVLKTFAGYIFKPTLPREKQLAIRNLGFGSPVKIYFEYAKDIKPWFRVNIRPLWSTKERKTDLMWTKQVVEISKLPASRRVLEIQVGGQFFHEIEKLPDVELLEKVTTLLRTFLKNPKIPYPTSMLRSNWSSCACYLGGRPFFSTESSPADVAALGAPLGDTPSLLFAGDATILHGFGTIDGARMSGIREAQRIVELYSKQG